MTETIMFEGAEWSAGDTAQAIGRTKRRKLTLSQQQGLASIKATGRAQGRTRKKIEAVLEDRLLVAPTLDARRPYALTEAGERALQRAISEAEARSAMALGNANAAREAGKPSARYDTTAQKWLDIANDFRGQGS